MEKGAINSVAFKYEDMEHLSQLFFQLLLEYGAYFVYSLFIFRITLSIYFFTAPIIPSFLSGTRLVYYTLN